MRTPEPIDMIRQLVAEPSMSSPMPAHDRSNRPVVERLAEWAEALGFRCELQAVAPANGGQQPHGEVGAHPPSGKVNLIATLGGDGEGGLVLSGHSDTVPTDPELWDGDPWSLREDSAGRLFGLGSADMKGFFGAALAAASRFRADQLRVPLTLVATADEESSMAGARALVAAGRPRAARVVIGEPTGLTPVRMHKGILMERLFVEGRSGHSSNPALGANAIEGMIQAMAALRAWREEGALTEDAFAVPHATLNFGRIEGGDSPNRICGSCSLTFDVRLLPGMMPARVRAELQKRACAAVDPAFRVRLEQLVEAVPPFAIDEHTQTVALMRELTGREPRAVMFCTEAPFFHELGAEVVVCGPGSIDVAHQPNEHVSRSQLIEAEDLYAQLIQRTCVDAASEGI